MAVWPVETQRDVLDKRPTQRSPGYQLASEPDSLPPWSTTGHLSSSNDDASLAVKQEAPRSEERSLALTFPLERNPRDRIHGRAPRSRIIILRSDAARRQPNVNSSREEKAEAATGHPQKYVWEGGNVMKKRQISMMTLTKGRIRMKMSITFHTFIVYDNYFSIDILLLYIYL